MEEGASEPLLSRKELRKQKLMEYLAAKGKLKPPNPTPSLHADCQNQKATKTSLKAVTGKENKAPPDRFRWQASKSRTVVPQFSQDPPRRRAFGVSDKVNVRDGKQNAKWSSSSRVSAQTKVNQKPPVRRTYTALSSRSNSALVSTLKKPPNTGSQTLSKVQSNGRCTDGAKSDPKSSSNRATLCPLETGSSRLSTGPLVKTKTGLVPAVIQPRNGNSIKSHLPAAKRQTLTTTSIAKKGQSSRVSSASGSHRPALVLPSDSRAGSKTEAQIKSRPNPLPEKRTQPTGRSQVSGGLRLTVPSRSKAGTVKPEQRVLTSRTAAGQPASRSVKMRSEAEGRKNAQSLKAGAPTASQTSIKCTSRTVETNKRTVACKGVGATKTGKETQINKEKPTRNVPSVHAARKCPVAPAVSQTAPQPSRSISIIGGATAMKTPKPTAKVVPQTEGKKMTTAQEERMRKLQEWRDSKGISYKRPPMQVEAAAPRSAPVPQPFWASMQVEDEAHSLIFAVDRSLADCIKLLAQGCPADKVKNILSSLPAISRKFAKYWICQARLMEQEGNLDVLPMFEEAVRVTLEPVDELRSVVFDILKKKKDAIRANETQKDDLPPTETSPDKGDNPLMTPKPVKVLINGERGNSSVVKYKITATPGGPPSQPSKPVRVNGREVRFFTPVRRSVRIERASLRYPLSLQDHDVCVNSYSELMPEEGREKQENESSGPASCSGNDTMYIYRENEALGDKVSIKLLLDDTF
ncbi:cytoskeleton-associated protein 2-like [Fundulus heteroclitus]|uniref:cytoskeleton-associated protein 2-like n=1 Tax=Fundulus heteroclitus TaxID=8078 RepID=UPI00165B0D98|nr:cytoskeleton-associated protein 2-like [Fundulus heteroclitus]